MKHLPTGRVVAHAWLLREAAVVWCVFASFGSSPNMLWILLSVDDLPKTIKYIRSVHHNSIYTNTIVGWVLIAQF